MSNARRRPLPRLKTFWNAFPGHEGFYRLFDGRLQYAPDRDGFPSWEERCDVDFIGMDEPDIPAVREIESRLREEPICGGCDLVGSLCACTPHGTFA